MGAHWVAQACRLGERASSWREQACTRKRRNRRSNEHDGMKGKIMRKVLRGYAKTRLAISFLSARCPFLLARTNALGLLSGKKDIWSGKAQGYLRKKLFVSHPRTLGTGKAARVGLKHCRSLGEFHEPPRLLQPRHRVDITLSILSPPVRL